MDLRLAALAGLGLCLRLSAQDVSPDPAVNSYTIPAHQHALACIAVNTAGSLLATASDKVKRRDSYTVGQACTLLLCTGHVDSCARCGQERSTG